MRGYAHNFRNLIQLHLEQLDRNRIVDNDDNDSDKTTHYSIWTNRYQAILEATIQLKQWNDLSSLVEEARSIADDHRLYAVFADMMLYSEEAPVERVIRILEVGEYIHITNRKTSVVNIVE